MEVAVEALEATEPVKWFQAETGEGRYTAWFQGEKCGSRFHLVRDDAVWDHWYVKTACGRLICQYDQWDKPGTPGHEFARDDYACPRCLRIFEREDPERFKRSQTYMLDLYAWTEAYPNQGPKPMAP